ANIDLVSEKHGVPGARNLEYDPSFIIRGLAEMHLELTAAPGFARAEPRGDSESRPAGSVSPASYSTATTRIGVLLTDPAATAVLDRHFPGVSTDARIGMA